jgi:hypothetical protein
MGKVVGINELARHLFCTRETLHRYEEAGVIERQPDGKSYDQDACREAVLKHLRARAPRGSSASAKLQEARARLTELRIRKTEHTLADVNETVAAMQFLATGTVNVLEGLPGSILRAREDRQLRAELEQWVQNARTRLGCRQGRDQCARACARGRARALRRHG